MNTIKQLIQQYCPDGVEYKKLGEVCEILRGKRLTKKDLSDEYEYPVFHGGLEPIGYYNKSNRSAGSVMIINVGASAGTIGYSQHEFWSSDGCFCLSHVSLLNQRFLFFLLQSFELAIKSKVRHAGIPTLDNKLIEALEIPVPPLPVQNKIVEILDSFTSLEAELEAELEARKKQYNYYRDQLLSFKHLTGGGRCDVVWKTLGEVFEMKAGIHINSSEINESKNGDTPYPCYGGNGIRGFVKEASKTGPNPIIGRQGALCGNIQYATGKYFATEHAVVVKRKSYKVDMRYAFYKLQEMDLNQYKSQGAQPGLAVSKLETIPFPLPPLSEQRRIVSILDRFETLVNDISNGLPAEIKARHQQYEYYRDQLLSFKRK